MQFETDTGPSDFSIEHLIVAGWTGRDKAAVQHHIDELAELGVPGPSQTPLYYRVSNTLLTAAAEIQGSNCQQSRLGFGIILAMIRRMTPSARSARLRLTMASPILIWPITMARQRDRQNMPSGQFLPKISKATVTS